MLHCSSDGKTCTLAFILMWMFLNLNVTNNPFPQNFNIIPLQEPPCPSGMLTNKPSNRKITDEPVVMGLYVTWLKTELEIVHIAPTTYGAGPNQAPTSTFPG